MSPRGELDPPQRAAIDRLTAGLESRFDEIDRCGLPNTLVHGDFHPGNVISTTR
jgi:Ser/Thr protein kinase RdoA (MazF antagonist)